MMPELDLSEVPPRLPIGSTEYEHGTPVFISDLRGILFRPPAHPDAGDPSPPSSGRCEPPVRPCRACSIAMSSVVLVGHATTQSLWWPTSQPMVPV